MRTLIRPATPVDSLTGPRRWTPVAAIIGAVALGLALIAGLILAAASLVSVSGHTTPATAPLTVPLAVPAVPQADHAAPATDLTLPQPTGYQDGVPVGYPNTQAGAVAAAYGYSRIATGLDVPATLRVIEAMSDPASGWFNRARGQIADGLVAQRRSLGLPSAGSPGMALINVSPSSYRVESTEVGALTVLTLNTVSTESADGTMGTGTMVFRWALRWDGARWLATRSYLEETDAKLAVAPFTSAAEALGWKAARGG
jgi:hypothetical protein